MKTFCDRWTDRTSTGCEIVELYQRKNGGWIGIVLFAFRPRAAHWNDTGFCAVAEVGELIAIPPTPVVRPFRDLLEFAAAVYAVMPADMRGVPPGMCLAFVRYRAKVSGTWLAFLPAGWDWPSLLENCEWTIDPMDPVGRPFGVEE